MAYASWKDIVITDGRTGPIYRLWDAVANKLTGDMAGKWTVVDVSATGWTSDTSPADGSWVVVQSESAWSNASKLQVFLGVRKSTGTLAGFGSRGGGVYSAVSPDGGWGTSGPFFGASPSNWRNTLLVWNTTYATACTFGLVLTSGTDGTRPGTLAVLTRSGTGNNLGTLAGALIPLDSLSDAVSRVIHVTGNARFDGATSYDWGYCTNSRKGLVPTPSLDAWDQAYAPSNVPPRDRESGAYTEADTWVVDYVTSGMVGLIDQIRASTAGNGDLSIDGTRHAYGGISYPREAARDGLWG